MSLRLWMLIAALAAAPAVAVAQPGPAGAAAEDARLEAFLNAEFEKLLDLSPQTATQLGRKDHGDQLNDPSEEAQLRQLEWSRGSIGRLKAQFDRNRLGPDGRLSYDLWAVQLDRAELSYRFRRQNIPLGSYLGSIHSGVANFMVNVHQVDTAADLAAYNARLRAFPMVLDHGLARQKRAAQAGIRAPRFGYERVISGSRDVITGQPFAAEGKDSPLYSDARTKAGRLVAAGKMTQAEADRLLADTRAILITDVKPAYERLIAWAEGDIANAGSGKVGALTLPDGAAYYAASLRLQTTTDLTAAQIHRIGLDEVKRIQGEQDALARKAGFADGAAYYAELKRLDPPLPFTDERRAEIIAISNANIARARAQIGPFFGLGIVYPVEVVRQPSFFEVAGGAAQASGPSPDGARPGRVYLHMLGTTPNRAGLASLMCHEGVPGHVMQGDIAVRQKAGPTFRKLGFGYAAFTEGWGLYAEALCKEMGVYEDIAQDFMRLDAELFRAARLVADTGIHADGWTEEEAVKYLTETGRRPPDVARSETRRYITSPGQATAYKIGMLRIQALRREAEKELGPRFDIRGFHDLVVEAGSMPLSMLEARVQDWIRARKAAA